ncbi:transcriptional regulator [Eggerthellaceae bacterium zg-893]|nr:transcriptional regulator [Eggerthellaceae bacterium zg-893]
MDDTRVADLVHSLIGYPSETEWIEFKENNKDPLRIGEDISALANAAAFHGCEYGYKVWGVRDDTHELVGTTFDYLRAKGKGNQDLLMWLSQQLSPNARYDFFQVTVPEAIRLVVLQVYAATGQPVRFSGKTYIREGSSTTTLTPGAAKESDLWRKLQRADFEIYAAASDLALGDVQELLAIGSYYELLGLRQPPDLQASLTPLIEQELIKRQDDGCYTITNLGAMLLAKKLPVFPGLRKRPLRIVRFDGNGNFDILDDRTFEEGYALAIPQAENYIMGLIPAREVTDGAFRKIVHAYPQSAVRELLVNAIVHQDATTTSSGPLVRMYDNRIEFSNPGPSLIPVDRVLNAQPKTRNNELVGLLRQMDLCEEGGTGWDRAVAACENRHMPAPRMVSSEELGTVVTLFSGNAFERMSKRERLDALYWHACLMYAQSDSMSNRSLRKRFGLDDERKNTLAISRLIREACNQEIVKEEDENAGTKFKRYIPFWA